MGTTLIQPSFSSGEISPELYGRSDMELFRTGVALAENFIVNYHGGLISRPGTKLVGNAASNAEVVLIPFQFSTEQTYVLEFTDKKIRVIADGGFVVDGDTIVEVVSPYLGSELERIGYTQSADVLTLFHRNHKITQLQRRSHTSWELVEFTNKKGPFEEINIDESKTVWSSGQNGTVTLTSSFDMFNDNHIGKLLKLEQQTSGQVTTWVQRMPVNVGDKTYYNGNYYICTEAVKWGDQQNSALTGDQPPTHKEGEEWDGPNKFFPDDQRDAYIGVKWKYTHSGFGLVRIDSINSATSAEATVIITVPETIIGGDTTANTWNYPAQTTQKVYVLSPAPTTNFVSDLKVTLVDPVGTHTQELQYPNDWTIDFQTSTLTLVNDPQYTPSESGSSVARDVKIEQIQKNRKTYKWAFEPWREDTKYPQCGTYYQQRFSVASTLALPQTLWMSRTDSFPDFSTSRPLLADDSMRFDVNSLQVNEILHMMPLNALLLFTSGGVWSINQGSNDVITPETPPNVRIQSYDGSSHVRPIITGSTGIYVQDGQQVIRDIGFDFSSDAYIGTDLTVRATHLFEHRKIVSWVQAKNPHKLIFVVFDDGEFAIFTYMKDQQIWGWCSGKTDGDVKYCTSIREGVNDAIYIAVNRNGVNYIERFMERPNGDSFNQFFVDSGLKYEGRNLTQNTITVTGNYNAGEECTLTGSTALFADSSPSDVIRFWSDGRSSSVMIITKTSDTVVQAVVNEQIPPSIQGTATTSWGYTVDAVSGLDHLNGKTVSILADGAVVDQKVVVNGIVQLDAYYSTVIAGLPYNSTIETLPLELSGYPETSRTKKKLVTNISVVVRNTESVDCGTSLNSMFSHKARTDENFGFAPRRNTGTIEVGVSGAWDEDSRMYVRQSDPIQTEILAIMPEITLSN